MPAKVMKLPDLARLRIVQYPDPVLRKSCAPIESFGDSLEALATRMFELMREAKGVGLAAPQVGLPIRLFVCNVTGEPADDRVMVNPRLVEGDGVLEGDEGCLSIPGVTVLMRRAGRVVIEACDARGRPFQATAEQLLARAWQHEMDHLDGRLIIDAMSSTDEIANRRAIRQLEADYEAAQKRRKHK